MTCENAFELISASLDGELTAAEEAQLREHLAHCPACRALQAELAGLQAATQAELETVAPPELKAKIMDSLPAQAKSAGKVVYWKRWGAMAAAIALVALAAWRLPRFVFDPVDVAPAADQSIAGATEAAADLPENPAGTFSYDKDSTADSTDVDTDAIPDAGGTYGAASTERSPSPAPAPASGATAPAANSAITNNAAPRTQSPSRDTAAPKAKSPSADTVAPERQSEDVVDPEPAQAENTQTESAQPDSVNVIDDQKAPLIVTTTAGDAPSAFFLPLPSDAPDEALPADGGEVQPTPQSAPTGDAGGGLLQSAPAPESAAEGGANVESRMAKLDTALIPACWCGVLTLAEYEPAADYPLEVMEDGQRQYTLPVADFQALIEALDADGAAYELRTEGDDIFPDAQSGLVIVPGQPGSSEEAY